MEPKSLDFFFSFSVLGKEIEFGKPSLYVGREETASPFIIVATCCENITTIDLKDETEFIHGEEEVSADHGEDAKRETMGIHSDNGGGIGAVIRPRCFKVTFQLLSLHDSLQNY